MRVTEAVLFLVPLLVFLDRNLALPSHMDIQPATGVQNCTNCSDRIMQLTRMRHVRIQAIKQQILEKLGMRDIPVVNKSDIPPEVLNKAVQQMHRTRVGGNRGKKQKHKPFSFYAQISEIISFAEEANNPTEDLALRFALSKTSPKVPLVVTRANLMILIRYKKKSRPQRNPHRRVRIKIYQIREQGSATENDLITTHQVLVRHTKWQKLILPTTLIQEVLDSSRSYFQLKILCDNCDRSIKPVMVHKSVRNKKRPIRTVPSKKRKGRKAKIRKNKRKFNSRRPYLLVQTKVRMPGRSLRKRHTQQCDSSKASCCKKPLYISFKDLGWKEWIIAPDGYYANYCQGSCPNPTMPDTYSHRHSLVLDDFRRKVQQPSINFCCSPRKMSPLSLLYFTDDGHIIKTDLPNMKVDDCGCA